MQQTLANYLRDMLGWESVYAYNNETFGPHGMLGRASERETVLVRDLRAALTRLNPSLPPEAIDKAAQAFTRFDFSRSMLQHNRELYRSIRDGVPVSYRDELGQPRHAYAPVERIGGDKEVEQIERIIELQKLRYSKDDPMRIDFDVKGDPAAVLLPPMILVPFVENAFKYGLNPTTPSFIEIQLQFAENSFEFSIRNSIHEGQEQRGNGDKGLGLQNVRRQLEILYPNKHELLISREEKTFSVTLRVFSLS